MGAAQITENLTHDDPKVTVVDYVDWDNRLNVAISLLGGWVNVGGFLTFIYPASYLYIPSLVCKSVDTKWHGSIDPASGDWQTAEITVSYGKIEDQVVDFGEIALDISAEALSLPGGMFRWAGGPDSGKRLGDDDVTPQAVIPGMTIQLKRKSPLLLLSLITANIGKVNNGVMSIAGSGFLPESVLFTGAKASRKVTSEGFELWDYDFNFVAKPHSWNKFFHKDGNLYYLSPRVYGLGNLSVFFS